MNTLIRIINGNSEVLNSRIHAARVAYEQRDIESSRMAHIGDLHQENHIHSHSELLKIVVFGGLDGIVTIFALVSGCVAVHFKLKQIFTICMGSLLADAFAMSMGEYVSSSAEHEFINAEKQREEWEIEHCPEEEISEMVEIYRNKHGFSLQDANDMARLAFKYKDFFISHMMVEELGLLYEVDESPRLQPIKGALTMFLSFSLFGSIPLLSFVFFELFCDCYSLYELYSIKPSYIFVCLCCVATLSILGMIKGKFCSIPPYKAAFTMVLSGLISASMSYFVASFISYISESI
ncbi:hypothetical protein cand_005200 [Cryptosporidium andersoni]|uniref:Integral membrane protein n=1 Tax=Cryptosporidium andersoni TaxID=117008 RepID=A0A1J4MN14_9CRYT|nr:hypothetical protein cand_005200 [Cryptosporidium andersoni]